MEDIKRFTFRIPSELFDKINKVAENNHRSVNAEIVVAIENYLDTVISEPQSNND